MDGDWITFSSSQSILTVDTKFANHLYLYRIGVAEFGNDGNTISIGTNYKFVVSRTSRTLLINTDSITVDLSYFLKVL